MNATEEIQNIQFSADSRYIDISTSEGFKILSSDPSVKLRNEETRGESNSY